MELTFNWIGGATCILSFAKVKIAIDPVLCPKGTVQDYFWFKSKRIEAPIYQEDSFKNIDLWLITHNHEDHLDEIGLSKIEKIIPVITNQNTAKKLQINGNNNFTVLKWKTQEIVIIPI